MKQVIFLLFCSIFSISYYAQETSDFIGKWQFYDFEDRDLSDTVGTKMMEKIMRTLTYQFMEEGNLKSSFVGTNDKGTWEFNKKLNTLIIYSSKGEILPYKIKSYSEKELRLIDRKERVSILNKVEITIKDTLERKLQPVTTMSATKQQLCKLWYLHKKENPEYSKEDQELSNALTKSFIYRFDEDGTIFTKAFSVENETQWVFGENNETVIIKGETFDVTWNILSIKEDELILSKGDLKDRWIFSTKER